MGENNVAYGTEVSATWVVKFYDIVCNFISLWFCNIFIADLQKSNIGFLLLSKIRLKCDKDYIGNSVFCYIDITVVILYCTKNVSIVYCYIPSTNKYPGTCDMK